MIRFLSALLLLWNSCALADVGPKVALALGGGAALGFSHIGVLQVLEEEGLKPDLVVGTSMGSIVGGYYSAGMPLDSIRLEADRLNIFRMIDWKIGSKGFFEWKKVRKRLEKRLDGLRIEGLPMEYVAVATDLYSGERVMLRDGELIPAMLASATIPGLYQPLEVQGRTLVDGGMVDDVPVLSAIDAGAEVVIAVDVSHPLISEDIRTPFDVMRQAFFIIQHHNVNHRRELADVVIRPDLDDMEYHHFSKVEEAIAAGRAATRAALPAIRAALKDKTRTTPSETGRHHE